MQYSAYQAPSMKPRNRTRKWPLFVLALLLLASGIYMGYLMVYPSLNKKSAQEIKRIANDQSSLDKNAIFIPAVSIKADIEEGGPDTLDKGYAWHRFPEQGNPTKGGNMIITGHSFVWGYRPDEVYKRSIFYDLKEIKVGDEVLINWDGKQYKYNVSKVKTVKPNAVEIEQPSGDPMLTIYTCTVGGSADGRVVVIAKPSK